jgi:hypothetical protein
VLDIEDEVNTDALMIAWRLSTSPHIAEGIIFGDLGHLDANGSFPNMIVIVLINSKGMIAIIGKEDSELVGRTRSFGVKFGLTAHASKFYSASSNALQRFPARSFE